MVNNQFNFFDNLLIKDTAQMNTNSFKNSRMFIVVVKGIFLFFGVEHAYLYNLKTLAIYSSNVFSIKHSLASQNFFILFQYSITTKIT